MAFDRKLLNQSCYPAPVTTGVATEDVCAALPVLRAQYYALMAGGTTQQVRDGDRWQSFHPGNAALLKREITRLEIICSTGPRAVRAGPPRPLFRQGYGSRYFGGY